MARIRTLLPEVVLPPNSAKPLIALSLTAWLMTVGGGVFLPVFPEMVEALRLDPEQAGFLAAAFTLSSALCTPIMGYLSDRIGRRRLLVASLLCYGVLGLAPAFLSAYESILASRLLLGVAKGGLTAAVLAIVVRLLSGTARTNVLGYATGFMTLSSIGTYLIGGFAGSADWRHAFFVFLLAVPVAGFATVALRGCETSGGSAERRADRHRSPFAVLGQTQVILLLAAIPVVSGAAQIMRVYGPLHLKTAFVTGPDINGVMLALIALGAVVVSALFSGRAARALGVFPAIALGLAVMTAAMIGLLGATVLALSGVCFFLLGAGFGLAIPNLFDALANQSEGNHQATVVAVGSSVNALGLFGAPLLMGHVWSHAGLDAVFLVAAGASLLGIVGLLAISRQPLCPQQND